MINLQPQIKYDIWKPLYYWMLEGKWRRWCIPPAILFMVSIWFVPLVIHSLEKYPEVQGMIRAFYFSLMLPLKFLFKNEFPCQKYVLILVVHAWYALLGALAGALARILWHLIKRKPDIENCYALGNEKVEQVEYENIEGNTNGK